MPGSALVYQAFDSDVFGMPFYRLTDPDSPRLAEEIAALADDGAFIVDAKLPQDETQAIASLEALGFRRICVQVALSCELASAKLATKPAAARIVDRLALDADALHAHATGFRFARFLQDPELPLAASRRLMERWIANSLSGRYTLAVIAQDFCSFKDEGSDIVIDLLSCLQTRRGHASALLQAVLAYGRNRNAKRVRVVTEAENLQAIRIYRRNGFEPSVSADDEQVVLHLVRTRGARSAVAS